MTYLARLDQPRRRRDAADHYRLLRLVRVTQDVEEEASSGCEAIEGVEAFKSDHPLLHDEGLTEAALESLRSALLAELDQHAPAPKR